MELKNVYYKMKKNGIWLMEFKTRYLSWFDVYGLEKNKRMTSLLNLNKSI